MQSLCGSVRLATRRSTTNSSKIVGFKPARLNQISSGLEVIPLESKSCSSDAHPSLKNYFVKNLLRLRPNFSSSSQLALHKTIDTKTGLWALSMKHVVASVPPFYGIRRPGLFQMGTIVQTSPCRCITTMGGSANSISQNASISESDVVPRIKFKRPDKTARHIMQILDKEAVEEMREKREIPDIRPGYIIQLKVEVPENKRRLSIVKGIVIARRNAGLNTTFRLRRLVAGVGVESLFPLYSPNIKEIKVLDKKKVRRAKLYYLRDKMNALKKH